MTGQSAKVYIVILNYKNWQDVEECLGSVFRSDYRNFTAIVIDNNSGNGSLEHLIDWGKGQGIGYRHFDKKDWTDRTVDPAALPPLTFLQNDVNNGFAGGNNLALRILLTEKAYIWLLNPDMVVQENTLSELVSFAGLHRFNSIIGADITMRSNQRLPAWAIRSMTVPPIE